MIIHCLLFFSWPTPSWPKWNVWRHTLLACGLQLAQQRQRQKVNQPGIKVRGCEWAISLKNLWAILIKFNF
jgi:hypothetical protein